MPEDAARAAKEKLHGDFRRRREARDELVDTLRRYGMAVLAAAVLLPPQLVALGLVGVGLLYLCNRYLWPRSGNRATVSSE